MGPLGPLWLFLSTPEQIARLPWSQVRWTHPPSHHHPPSPLPPTHPLIHDTRDITETFQKTFTKPVILTSCQLVHIMLAITLVYYWSKSGVATIKHQRNTYIYTVPWNIEIGISRNTKCAIWNGFQDPVTYRFCSY